MQEPPATQPPKRSIFTPQAEMSPLDIDVQPSPRRSLPVSLSLVLLATAIGIGGAIIGWTSFFQQSDNIEIRPECKHPARRQSEMTGARYSGKPITA